MHIRFSIAILLTVLNTYAAHAEAIIVPSDLAVTMMATPDRDLMPYQIIDLTITVTNRGPLRVSRPFLHSSYFSDEFALAYGSNDCGLGFAVLDSESSFSYVYLWYQEAGEYLDVGQSKVCHARVALSPTSPAIVPFTFRISEEYVDLDPSNDVATIYLQREATAVPTSSPLSKISLLFLLTVFAFVAFTRQRKECSRRYEE